MRKKNRKVRAFSLKIEHYFYDLFFGWKLESLLENYRVHAFEILNENFR